MKKMNVLVWFLMCEEVALVRCFFLHSKHQILLLKDTLLERGSLQIVYSVHVRWVKRLKKNQSNGEQNYFRSNTFTMHPYIWNK